ncbi:MAG TPA: phenylacetic acid degradation bifunctional protein PaaZ [Vicinamibacteria bacterium]|nr:phenylacetic acid degradation bifunctional protein PaaZ [Vicinamibacteria bacterium]
MITLQSYVRGEWKAGVGPPRLVRHAVTGEAIAQASSEGIDLSAMLDHARTKGGPALRAMTFPERASILKEMAGVLNQHLDELHAIAASYGATPKDARFDVEGGIGTLAFYASLGARKLPNSCFLVDGDAVPLSRDGNFVGRHVYVPLEGAAVQINAYNFPSWGMLEKFAPAFLSGVPSIVKPATPTAWLAHRLVEILIEARVVPEGTLQLVCGSVGDLLSHLTCQDIVCFTGSAATGAAIRSHPTIVKNAVRFNIEADSLNCILLGPDVTPGSTSYDHFLKEILSEMTVKAGQKCTAIRRVLVPEERSSLVVDALKERLAAIRVGDPREEGVRMGPLVDADAVRSAREGISRLRKEADVVFGDPERSDFASQGGFFMEPVLLLCRDQLEARAIHEVEVFGPVATVINYDSVEQALELARRGDGSLVGTIFSDDEAFVRQATFALAPYHGRLMVMDAKSAPESTGHGIVMPHLVHGGPGRAGGGEELGGQRSLYHYMQRVALQGDPERLEKLLAPALSETQPT